MQDRNPESQMRTLWSKSVRLRISLQRVLPIRTTWPGAILLLVLSVLPAFAQYRTSIQGTVTDPQGAVIPGATLTLINRATSETITRKSDEAGVFNFNALPSARFTLTAER